jgi:PAS domain-containing protein
MSAIGIWDIETGEIIWSDETYRIFGFKPQERPMDIETVSGLIHPDDRGALYSTVDEEVAVGVHPVHQHRIVRPSGEVRTVQSITSKLWKTTDVGPGDGVTDRDPFPDVFKFTPGSILRYFTLKVAG